MNTKKRRDSDDEDLPREEGEGASDTALAAELTAVQEQLAKAIGERDEMKDRYARSLAEMENLRKRTAREIEDGRRYSVASIARDLIEVQDNLHRALAGVPAAERDKGLAGGVSLVEAQLAKLLASHGVEPVLSVGQPFDPAFHQAISTEAHPEFPPGTVTSELVKGYRIHDRLLRPAMVRVAEAPKARGDGDGGDET